jgi:hypothetical protein
LAGGRLSGNIADLTLLGVLPLLFNRIMIGLVIGISALNMNYLLHGAFLGLLLSLISSLSILQASVAGFVMFSLAGLIYGALIEWFVTKIFKCPSPS